MKASLGLSTLFLFLGVSTAWAQACIPRHIVEPGDSLGRLAETYLGARERFVDIYRANRAVIGGDPNTIRRGTVLTIPCDVRSDTLAPFVSHATAAALIGRRDVQVVDIRPRSTFGEGLLPHSLSLPFDGWRSPGDNPGAPAAVPDLERMIGGAGLRLDQPILLVHERPTPFDTGRAAYVAWLLKSLGARDVGILRGGYRSWQAAGQPIVAAPVRATPVVANLTFNPAWTATREEVAAISAGEAPGTLLDVRPPSLSRAVDSVGRFLNTTLRRAETRPVGPLHTIASADDVGMEVLLSLKEQDIDWQNAPVISFCNTGELAALTWYYASEVSGLDNVKLYPESTVGWVQAGGALVPPEG
ncbi:MAG: rhodanese-like domain-containing protein [Pseudomonadota bacterium]